jgi:hypothetical protein
MQYIQREVIDKKVYLFSIQLIDKMDAENKTALTRVRAAQK